ncbi:MAG: LacI family transcriptional regulator [Eubacterium sp.]|nr:LacI family transcriptional regulator [Eubacterium sp.]
MEKKKLTINEIAKKANVSIATVSRIINGKKNVKPDTEQNVMNVIAQLEKEYGLDNRFLNRTNPFILVVAEFDSPVLNDFAAGVQKKIFNRGYHVITIDYSKYRVNLLSEINYLAKNIPISGIIMLNNYEPVSDIESFTNRFPVVTAYTDSSSSKISLITIDDYLAGQTVANHILSLGCENIVLLAINDTFSFSRLRQKGILGTITQAGITIPEYNLIHLPGFDFDIASSLLRQRFQENGKPDAVIGINDALAAIAIRESKRFGYRVPEDILIAGFDNAEISTLTTPNLTTINQKSYHIGMQAANMILNTLEHPKQPVQHIVLQGELIVRESTLR